MTKIKTFYLIARLHKHDNILI